MYCWSSFSSTYRDTVRLVPPHEPTLRFPVWGFYVYRVTYKDQALWEQYTKYITKSIEYQVDLDCGEPELMRASGRPWSAENPNPRSLEIGRTVKKHFHLCTKEGPELDGKTIEEVREIHLKWLDSLPNEGISHNEDGSHNCADLQTSHTRYHNNFQRYCHDIYVDDDILARFASDLKADQFRKPGECHFESRVSVVVFRALDVMKVWEFQWMAARNVNMDVDTDSESEEDDDEDEVVDGQGEKLWMYVSILHLANFYSELKGDEGWDRMYKRPPKVWRQAS